MPLALGRGRGALATILQTMPTVAIDSSYINPLHYACRRVANCRSWFFPPSLSLLDEDDLRSAREIIYHYCCTCG